ncbi:efflux RND transporter periplasmic adaptor subunit [Desulfocastanea catecholica]
MRRFLAKNGKTLLLVGILLLLLGLFVSVLMRSGPLAPVPVSLATVELKGITPALFGIGTVEARFIHKIGPTLAGRIKHINVEPGDHVQAGQLLGEMDAVDLVDRISAHDALIKRADAAVLAAKAHIQEINARKKYAEAQAKRYEQLFLTASISKESVENKRQDYQIAEATLAAATADLEVSVQDAARLRAERDGLIRQRDNLRFISPVDGFITRRDADVGTTVVPGQTVIEVVEPGSIWINVRFDQQRAVGLRAGLPAQITLRSSAGGILTGQVERIEPMADSVTEEILAKVRFDKLPATLPPLGELAEVTVQLDVQKVLPAVRNASVQRVNGHLGVWLVDQQDLRFVPVKTGVSDLDGWVQITDGLVGGEQIVVYSRKALRASSRVKIVEHNKDQSS